jgi:hypothetical protein
LQRVRAGAVLRMQQRIEQLEQQLQGSGSPQCYDVHVQTSEAQQQVLQCGGLHAAAQRRRLYHAAARLSTTARC